MAAARMNRPLVLLDLAVPRDIEPSARDCPGIALYDMDDLQRPWRATWRPRGGGGRGARARRRGGRALRALAGEPRRRADDLRAAPARRRGRARGARRERARWESLSAADRERVEVMARAVVAGCCTSRPSGSRTASSYHHLHTLRELFGLDPAPAEEPPPPRSHASRRAAARRDPAGNARQRARPGAGGLGRRTAGGRSRAGPDRHLGRPRAARPRRQVALREGDRGGAAGRRGGLAVTPRRTCPASCPAASRSWASPRAPTRVTRSAAQLARRAARRGRGRHREPAPALPAWPCGRTWRCATCAGTWTRGCGAWPKATSTRSCWPPRGSLGSGGRARARRWRSWCPQPARAASRWRRGR